MRDKYGLESDSYCYANSLVLVNKLNIKNATLLENAEVEFSTLRAEEYTPSFQQFNFEHLKSIHFHLFQDIYDWAGETRRVDISKNETRFCNVHRISSQATKILTALSLENNLCDLQLDNFISRVAYYYCELNILHPFRDGNGRTERIFFEELAINAEFSFDWSKIEKSYWLTANIAGYHGDICPLTDIFKQITTSF